MSATGHQPTPKPDLVAAHHYARPLVREIHPADASRMKGRAHEREFDQTPPGDRRRSAPPPTPPR
jgi:hypothetical protein